MFLTWISLFGRKMKNGVYISSTLGMEQQETISFFFEKIFNFKLILGGIIQIRPFYPVFLKAMQTNRSIEELLEISHLIPQKEREFLKKKVAEWEEETNIYA